MSASITETIDLPARGGSMQLRRWQRYGQLLGQDNLSRQADTLLLHANGLTALSYDRLLGPLADELGTTIIAPDQRGHGRTTLPADPDRLRSWHPYARDGEALLQSLPVPEGGWRLIGHSMGALIALMIAGHGNVPVRSVTMIEPVILPRIVYLMAHLSFHDLARRMIPIARKAASRRADFPSREAVRTSYARKAFFAGWADGVLDDYLADGLIETGTGVGLACAPAWEAATFAAQAHSFWHSLDKAMEATGGTVHALVAERNSTSGAAGRSILKKRGLRPVLMPQTGHLAPQERPADVAALILAHLG